MAKKEKEPSYTMTILSYYFAHTWESFFKILYLIFFAYFLIFNSGKIIVAFNFIVYTLLASPSILTLQYLFWGVIFLISLIIPFSVSLYAITLFYEIWVKSIWKLSYKYLMTISIILAVPLIIIFMDDITRTAGNEAPLLPFTIENQLDI